MARPLDVFVCEPAGVDVEVFLLWLSGYDADKASGERMGKESGVAMEFHDFQSLLLGETQDQFRMFRHLEPYLQSPPTLFNTQLFQLSVATKRALIEQYYAFDEAVVRVFLGKKLSTRNRKDLDDVSEKTGILLKSCRRQFDNIKQVLRVVDDYEGSLVENIKLKFLLPETLARSYASVVFISHNRFETNKRKLAHLTFTDFTCCASQMIDRWTAGSEGSHAVDDDLELDRDFLHELHDLKLNMIDRVWIDRQQKLVLKDLRKRKLPTPMLKSVEQNFKSLSKAITNLGASLIHSKDLKDFFVDLVEKIVEPCKQQPWGRNEMDLVISSIAGTFAECESAHSKQTGRPTPHEKPWRTVYLRYIDTLRLCVLTVYHD